MTLMTRTVQMTLDEPLLDEVDRAVEALGTNRSAFTRTALREALDRRRELELEERHRRGYQRHPVTPDEVEIWENVQVWPD
jgi:metal-responsive CopG/Arc/MetJ family transcriptional regulator